MLAIEPVVIRLGWIAIRWYGLAYCITLAVSYLIFRTMVRSGKLPLSMTRMRELLLCLSAGVIVGGRCGWWLLYHRNGYLPEPWYEVLAVWHGGMSFHGGLIGTLIAMLVWCHLRRVEWRPVMDAAALALPVGIGLVRMANFANGELIGRVSSVPWAVIFPGEVNPRHPAQLYEAVLAGPILLACLVILRRWPRLMCGQTAATFCILYGVMRFCVEFARNPDGQIGFLACGWVTMGQILSIATTALGLYVWLISQRVQSCVQILNNAHHSSMKE